MPFENSNDKVKRLIFATCGPSDRICPFGVS